MPATSKSLRNSSRQRTSRCAGETFGPRTWIAWVPRLLALAVQRADRRIIIQRGALDVGQGLDVAGALVDPLRAAAGDAGPDQMMLAGDDVAGVAEAVADLPEGVAHGRGPEHRDHQIGAL